MKSEFSPKLSGKLFFARIKKKDKFYFRRLSERYRDLRDNVTKIGLLSEQEMFLAYLDLMDTLLQIYSTNEGM